MASYLLIDGPGMWAYQFVLEDGKPAKVGRSKDNEIKLTDSSISGHHAVFLSSNGKWMIRDNQSSNGTYVNDVRIKEKILMPGDTVRIGKTELVYFTQSGDTTSQFADRTQMIFSQQEVALRDTMDNMGAGDRTPTATPPPRRAPRTEPPTEHLAPITQPFVDEDDEELQDFAFDPDQYSTPAEEETTRRGGKQDDSLWVAEKVAHLFGELARFSTLGKKSMYERMLQYVRDSIGADNGFLMLADRQQKRWVIKAFVGDKSGWDTYEKEHPVPLKVANQAFKEDRVVSNAMNDGQENDLKSQSMMMLDVHCYIAVPLHRETHKEGVLYFDTRKSLKMFTLRDVKLLDRIGSYILSLENEKGA